MYILFELNDLVTKTGSMPCHKENLNFRRLKSSKMLFVQSENKLDINSRRLLGNLKLFGIPLLNDSLVK